MTSESLYKYCVHADMNDLHCGSCGRLLYSVPSPYAITQQQRKKTFQGIHTIAVKCFELPYSL